MELNLSQVPTKDLEEFAGHLFQAASSLRSLALYSLAARVRAVQVAIDGEALQRASDAVKEQDRQLSLVPPGAYDERD